VLIITVAPLGIVPDATPSNVPPPPAEAQSLPS